MVKVKFSLRLITQHFVETYERMGVKFSKYLTSALGGGAWSASRPGRITTVETNPVSTAGTCMGPSWMGVSNLHIHVSVNVLEPQLSYV
jgi:hypothetical protein